MTVRAFSLDFAAFIGSAALCALMALSAISFACQTLREAIGDGSALANTPKEGFVPCSGTANVSAGVTPRRDAGFEDCSPSSILGSVRRGRTEERLSLCPHPASSVGSLQGEGYVGRMSRDVASNGRARLRNAAPTVSDRNGENVVTPRRDAGFEDCSLGQRATQTSPWTERGASAIRALVGSLQGEREKPEADGDRSAGDSALAVVHTERRVPTRPDELACFESESSRIWSARLSSVTGSRGVRHEPVAGSTRLGRGRDRAGALLYEVTAYSHGCILPRDGKEGHARRAANGRWPVADITVAADTSLHAFGAELLIEGLGFRTVGDRGHAIKGRKLDLFVDTCGEARRFGRRWLRVHLVPPDTTREARRATVIGGSAQ